MTYGPIDFEQDDLLEESIYDEVENYYGDDLAEFANDLAEFAQYANWN